MWCQFITHLEHIKLPKTNNSTQFKVPSYWCRLQFQTCSGLSNVPARAASTAQGWGIRTAFGKHSLSLGTTTSRTISCAGSFHQLLLLLSPVQDRGHKVLSSFRHLINGKNSLASPKAKLQRTCHGTSTAEGNCKSWDSKRIWHNKNMHGHPK